MESKSDVIKDTVRMNKKKNLDINRGNGVLQDHFACGEQKCIL